MSEQYVYKPKIVEKPWGRELIYAHTLWYAGKILEVKEGHSLSLQKHEKKQETIHLLNGSIIMILNDDKFEMNEGDCILINPGDVHRIIALTNSIILEVSTPYLDDIIRLDDQYGRV